MIPLPTRKVEALLAFLVLYPEEHAREKLASLFWGDFPDMQARSSLRNALTILRKHLDDHLFLAERESVRFNPVYPLWVDALEFEKQVNKFISEASPDSCLVDLELYQGDLLPDWYDDWVVPKREHYRNLYLNTLLRLTEGFRSRGQYENAVRSAQMVLLNDPSSERAHQHLMFCYVALGNRSAALRQYEECEHILRDDLGVRPMPATVRLYERIKESVAEHKPREAMLTNMPIPLTSFIGRERELEEVKPLLFNTRLLTLTGAGGSGKTRLAIRVATDLIESFKDGVWWVDLAPLMDQMLVPQAVASVLGIREMANQSLIEALTSYLREKDLLLVLDNCEHLVRACAHVAQTLLSVCPNVKILATSREGIGLTGETVWRVPGLSIPDRQHVPAVDTLTGYDGVRLFVERAAAVAPGFSLTQENAATVAQLCIRLDGIPLAIELATACVKVLTVEQIMMRLEDRYHLLIGGSRTALPRHRTLRATMDWSFKLLSEEERMLFRRLAVFAGTCSLDAVESICSGDGIAKDRVLILLASLIDKSLVTCESNDGTARYRLLDTIREYGQVKLQQSAESQRVRNRHLDFFLALAEKAETGLLGAEQLVWLRRLGAEHDNLRTALKWSEGDRNRVGAGLRLASALWRFWEIRGYLSEGREWLAALLSRSEAGDGRAQARAGALNTAGRLALFQSDFTAARLLLEESLATWQDLGPSGRWGVAISLMGLGRVAFRLDDFGRAQILYEASLAIFRELGSSGEWGIAASLMGLGIVASSQGDYARALALIEESLALCRKLGDQVGIAASLKYLGDVVYRQGDYGRTLALTEESLAISKALEDKVGIGMSLNHLGDVAYHYGDYDRAVALYGEGLEIFRQVGVKGSIVMSLNDIGQVALARGDRRRALALFRESISLAQELGSKWDIGWCLEGLAVVAALAEQPERAARLFGAVEAMFESIGVRVRPDDRADHDRNVAAVHSRLDEETFAKAWEQGRAMTVQQSIAYAIQF